MYPKLLRYCRIKYVFLMTAIIGLTTFAFRYKILSTISTNQTDIQRAGTNQTDIQSAVLDSTPCVACTGLDLKDGASNSSDLSTLIVYAYAPGEYRDINLNFFVRKGGIVDDATYQYVFIASGASWANLAITKDILKFENVKLMERENTGYDSCAWKQVLTEYGSHYARFILLNGSGRGPFLTNYAPVYWPEYFLKPFENSNVGLSGSTFNCDRTHIQSNILGFTKKTYQIIYDTLGCFEDKDDVIFKGEIAYSNNILNAGYNLFVMMLYYKGHDFTDKEKTAKKCNGIPIDIYYSGEYFGIDYNPLELIFIKTNRDLNPKVIEKYSLWALESNKFQ